MDLTVTDLREKIERGQATITDVRGVQCTTTTFGEKDEAWEKQEIAAKPPSKHRQETIETGGKVPNSVPNPLDLPDSVRGQLFVVNGTTGWQYNPETKTVRRYSRDDEPAESFIDTGDVSDLLTPDIDIEYTDEKTIAGRNAHEFSLSPPASNPLLERATLALDVTHWYPLKRTDTVQLEGHLVSSETRFEEVRFNDGLADDLFDFEPPASATIVDATESR